MSASSRLPGFRGLPQASLETLMAKRPRKYSEKRLRAYKFVPRTPHSRPRTATRRLKTPDVLLNSPDAQVYSLPDIARGLFIIRPPPSAVPPDVALPIFPSSSGRQEGFVHPLASSSMGLAMDGLPRPALRRPRNRHLAPLVLESKQYPGFRHILPSRELDELKNLRRENPSLSVEALAQRFKCLPAKVQLVLAQDVSSQVDTATNAEENRDTARKAERREQHDRYVALATSGRDRKRRLREEVTFAHRSWKKSLW